VGGPAREGQWVTAGTAIIAAFAMRIDQHELAIQEPVPEILAARDSCAGRVSRHVEEFGELILRGGSR
jgi:hypothetical protein